MSLLYGQYILDALRVVGLSHQPFQWGEALFVAACAVHSEFVEVAEFLLYGTDSV